MAGTKTQLNVEGRQLQLSNLEKLMYPAAGFTKGQVIDYYIRISGVLLPHLHGRPLTMKRYPDGIHGPHFYEKDRPSHTPEWIKIAPVPRRSDGTSIRYIMINDLPSLVWSANLANLEMHTVLSRAPKVDTPTMVVFDLDPGEPANFLQCAEVAFLLKDILDQLKLQSFAKSSGSKGIQIYIPLNSPAEYDVTSGFAKTIADHLHQQHPDLIVSEMAKRLRTGKVFIDWSQNSEHKTTVTVYSLRAKHDEPYVSMPFAWDELSKLLKKGDPGAFLIGPEEALKRVEKNGDLFEPVLKLKQKIPARFIDVLASRPAAKRSSSKSKAKGTSIQTYNEKRDFSQTKEPPGSIVDRKEGSKERMYVIQKHIASHLHYDFRLEMQGVLRSWAVPKGIPTELKDRKLAMHVEDHPMDYAKFEGIIPKGNYGAGTVMVWDMGTYTTMEENAVSAYYAGKLHLYMKGKKLNGEWVLVKTGKDDPRQWLLMKAGQKSPPITAKQDDQSVLTGRTMKQIAADNDAQWISNRPAKESKRRIGRTQENPVAQFSAQLKELPSSKPRYIEPMQSKPVSALPAGDRWIYELKFDGYRALGIREKEKVKLISRSNKDLSKQYSEIVESLKTLPESDWVVDGEIVALDENGTPSFQLLQNIQSQNGDRPLHYFCFDLLHFNGKDLTGLPLFQRKQILETLISSTDGRILYSASIEGDPEVLVREVKKRGLEGVVAKRKESKYESGKRTGAWMKFKTEAGQEFVIGGYKPSAKSNSLDSVLAGYYEGKKLIYAASVRAGFTPHSRSEVYSRIHKLETKQCPFANLPEEGKGRWGEGLTAEDMEKCIWVKPQVVCRIDFTEWTTSNHLRHSKFAGLIEDKKPQDVVKES